MKTITFVTGNKEKIRDAQHVAKNYDIEIKPVALEINEIQHHDPLKIAEHKAKSACQQLNRPVVINDSSWSIPALGGFPGGYMKDITSWLSTDDFINLMANKDDKSIILTDVNGYFDGKVYKSFVTKRYGKFVSEPRGKSGPSFARVVMMENDDITISEIFDQSSRTVDSSRYAQWHEFMDWFSSNN